MTHPLRLSSFYVTADKDFSPEKYNIINLIHIYQCHMIFFSHLTGCKIYYLLTRKRSSLNCRTFVTLSSFSRARASVVP